MTKKIYRDGDVVETTCKCTEVVMVASGTGYDAHCTVKSSNPELALGEFVFHVETPQEFKEQFETEFNKFVDSLIDSQAEFKVVH